MKNSHIHRIEVRGQTSGAFPRVAGCIGSILLLILFLGFVAFYIGENKEKNSLGSLQKSPRTTDAIDTTPAEPIEIRRALPIGEKSSPLDLIDKNSINNSFVVRGLTANDVLNVRTGSSARHPVVAKLPNGARGIHLMGESVQNGETLWVLVRIGSVTGWVNRQFLVEE